MNRLTQSRAARRAAHRRLTLLGAAAAASLAGIAAQAQTWVGPGGGTFSGAFSTASNWSSATVPLPTSTATFSLNQTYTVTFTTNVTNAILNFSNGTGTTTFSSSGTTRAYRLDNSANFTGGTAVFSGLNLNVFGTVSVNAAAASNVATLTLRNSAAAFVELINTLGNGSTSLNIQTGATLSSDSVTIGGSAGGTHTLNISGAGSSLSLRTSQTLNVGTNSIAQHATFNLTAGGAFLGGPNASSDVTIGSGGVMNVNAGSFSNRADLLVRGAVHVTNGGGINLALGQIVVAGTTGANAAFTLDGATSSVAAPSMMVGDFAGLQHNGGSVTIGGELRVAGIQSTGTAGATYQFNGGSVNAARMELGGSHTFPTTAGPGTFNHAGGTVSLSAFLSMANGGTHTATYNLLSNARLVVATSEFIGQDGTATFNHAAGGTNAIGGAMFLGDTSGGVGVYNLAAGASLEAHSIVLNNGTFNQQGGSIVTSDGNVSLGSNGRVATWNMSNSASLTIDGSLTVGSSGTGVFNQLGGTNSVGSLTIGSGGTYHLASSGSISVAGALNISGGVFNHGGATSVANVMNLASLSISSGGEFNRSSSLSLNIAGPFTLNNSEFNHSGGTVTAASLSLLSGATYNFSNAVSLSVSGPFTMSGTSSAFNQFGGTNTLGSLSVQSGTYRLSNSGVLNVGGNMSLSSTVFNHASGTVTAAALTVGPSATYNFSNTASLNLSGALTITGATSAFNQIGGSNKVDSLTVTSGDYNLANAGSLDVTGPITLGSTVFDHGRGSTVKASAVVMNGGATYHLATGATLQVAQITVGNSGNATFNQQAGVTLSLNALTLGSNAGSVGLYNLSNSATLNIAADLVVGNSGSGTFSQSGGINAVAQTLRLGRSSSGAGNYSLSGASRLTAQQILIGESGTGTLAQSGGTVLSAATIVLGQGVGASGSYTLSGGSATAGGGLIVGDLGSGNFNYTGGTLDAPSLTLASTDGSSGHFTLGPAVTLTTTGAQTVGGGGNATFSHAGTNNVGSTLTIGTDNIGTAEYNIIGGRLTAASIDVNARGSLNLAANANPKTIQAATLNIKGALNVRGSGTIDAPLALARNSQVLIDATLQANSTIAADDIVFNGTGTLSLGTAARLVGNGRVNTALANAGTIQAKGGNLSLRGNLVNTGTLGNLTGSTLFVESPTLTHSGNISVNAAGAVVFDAPITNASGKSVTLQGGALATPLLTNAVGAAVSGFGQITGDFDNLAAATFIGPTQIVGNFSNRAGAVLTVMNDQTLITGAAVNNGTITTVNGKVVFVNGVSAAGPPAAAHPRPGPVPGDGIDDGGTLTLTGPSTLVASYLRGQSLNLNGNQEGTALASLRPKAFGGETSVLQSLSIAASGTNVLGRLDLADNSLIYDYETTSPINFVQAMIAEGFADGSWNGNGITSSTAAAESRLAIGFAEAADILGPTGGTFQGQPADGTSLLIRTTIKGDANLDGTVGFADLVALAQHYNASGGVPWNHGDFNYDGNVGFPDLVALAQNYNSALPTAPIPGATAAFHQDLAAAIAQVPEPSLLTPLTILTLGLLNRRKRKITLENNPCPLMHHR